MYRRFLPLTLVALFPLLVVGQQKTVKEVPIRNTSPADAKAMYQQYCATCHGLDGKGGGPAASALKTPPADLTKLAKLNGGKFPSRRVYNAIRGEANITAHGSKEMPVWGHVFFTLGKGDSEVHQRLANLTAYVQGLQEK